MDELTQLSYFVRARGENTHTMSTLRTPDKRFDNLPDFPFTPNYLEVEDKLRMHYLDEGPTGGKVILLLHGEPTWSYLYRNMIPPLVSAGYRCVAPDLIGFGRSDKPTDKGAYSYASHLRWLTAAMDELNLRNINLFCHDWGGLLGLRLVAADPERFATVTATNTFLPTGEETMPPAFLQWRESSQDMPEFTVGPLLQMATTSTLTEDVLAAYEAPFPDDTYKVCARVFPALVPISPDDPEAVKNRKAWQVLEKFEKPFLTLFGTDDPFTQGGERAMQERIPGAHGQPHARLEGGHHFIQEDAGAELSRRLIDFLSD